MTSEITVTHSGCVVIYTQALAGEIKQIIYHNYCTIELVIYVYIPTDDHNHRSAAILPDTLGGVSSFICIHSRDHLSIIGD